MEMYSPSGHPRCRWAFVFFRTDLEEFSIISLDLAFWTEAVVDLFLTNATFRKMLIDKLDLCGLLWCFISYLDSHYDVTHSPQRIHWRASDVMLNFSKSVSKTRQTHTGWPRVSTFLRTFYFWVNCSHIITLMNRKVWCKVSFKMMICIH